MSEELNRVDAVAWFHRAYICTRSTGQDVYSMRRLSQNKPSCQDIEVVPLYAHPAPSDQEKLLISELADALEDARNNGFGEAFFRTYVDELLILARQIGDTK